MLTCSGMEMESISAMLSSLDDEAKEHMFVRVEKDQYEEIFTDKYGYHYFYFM